MIGTAMLGMTEMVAGLGWDPEIRGLLTVALSMAILAGSVWLLLVTNTGTRLGSLIALAGFWGWMFVMGIFWWIYGIGWAGSLPTWEVQDVFIDQAGAADGTQGLQEAIIGNVDDLPDSNCFEGVDSFPPAGGVETVALDLQATTWALCTPRAIEVLMVYPGDERDAIVQELLNPKDEASKIPSIAVETYGDVSAVAIAEIDGEEVGTCPGAAEAAPTGTVVCIGANGVTVEELLGSRSAAERDTMFNELVSRRQGEVRAAAIESNDLLGDDFRALDADELEAKIAEDTANAMLRIDELTLSQLEALAPQVNEWAEESGLIQLDGWTLQSTSQAGEAAATADAFLREDLFPEGDFLVLDAYQQGGKAKRDGRDMWTRIKHKITSTAQITHPTNYTVVNVQQTLEKPVDPSKPPPIPEINPDEPTYSVVMTRNLGNLRLIPGLFTIVSLILFALTCMVLHWRDLGLREKGLDV